MQSIAVQRLARLAGAVAVATLCLAGAASAQTRDGESGLPVPRFASLKSDRVNVRKGPGKEYGIAWVYERAGLPVEILKEFQTWRQIRDSDGEQGWVQHYLLSGRRTALLLPWEAAGKPSAPPIVELRDDPSAAARVTARAEAGAIVGILSCDRAWCWVAAENARGYVEQPKLWGVYPDEVVE
jgi:SH3-like domain-containing protein